MIPQHKIKLKMSPIRYLNPVCN